MNSAQAHRVDWHVIAHRLPGLLGLLLAAILAAWLVYRFVPASKRLAIVRYLFLLLVYVAVAAQTLTSYAMTVGFRGDDYQTGLEVLLSDSAQRPYAYRRLAVDAIRAISSLESRVLSERIQKKIERQSHVNRFAFHGDTLREFRTPSDTIPVDAEPPEIWNRQKALDFHAAYAFTFLCFFAILWLARAWTRELFPDSPLFADMAPAIALTLRLYTEPFVLYDASETLLVLAAAMCLTQKRIWVHLPIFMLAVFNKESNLLLAPVAFVALAGAIPWRRWVAAGVAHAVVGIAMIVWVYHAYGHNPGGPTQNHLADNIMFWSNPADYFRVREIFAPLIRTPIGVNPLLAIPTAGLLALGFRPAPSIIRRMLVTSLILTIPLILLFGYGDEIRDLGMASAAIYATACYGVRRLYAGIDQPDARSPVAASARPPEG